MVLCSFVPSGALAQEEIKAKDSSIEENGPQLQAKTRVLVGGVSLGGFYQHYSGFDSFPYYYPGSPPFWSGPPYLLWPYPDLSPSWYYPGYSRSFSRSDGMGEVRLQTSEKSAEVLLDGAYAGVAEDLKSIWLEPGAYTLEVRTLAGEQFKKRIYVLSGKTVKVSATLTAEAREAK
jgi:hypothetical protein